MTADVSLFHLEAAARVLLCAGLRVLGQTASEHLQSLKYCICHIHAISPGGSAFDSSQGFHYYVKVGEKHATMQYQREVIWRCF